MFKYFTGKNSRKGGIGEREGFSIIIYINRLIGVVIGLLILATLIKSLSLWSQDKWIPFTAFFALMLVSFTGWVGSIVVSTNLLAIISL